MSTNPTLYRFHGGLHLQDHKAESLVNPLQQASLADELVIRVSQHIGEANTPVVNVGDAVKRGQLLAESHEFVSAPVHAPASGVIKAIEARPIAHPSGQTADCFVMVPWAGEEQSQSKVAHSQDPREQLKTIRAAGIVGLGGAVFPSAAKLATALKTGIDTLIINGAECEPYITCDDSLMQHKPEDVVRGIAILQNILQPRQTLVGIEDNKAAAIQAMQQALLQSELMNTAVVSIPTLYPSGGEKQLIKILTGHEVHSGELAFDMGIFCQNVGTCSAIARAIDHHEPLISRIVTVTGPGIKNPGNWITPLGTPIRHLIELAGGYSVQQPKLIMGGPMMGLDLKSDQVPVVKATNCILVLNQEDQPEPQDCIRCGRCEQVCPAQLLPQQLYWNSHAHQFENAEQYHLFDCIECGCCSAVCPSHIPLVQYYRFAKSEIWEQRRKTYKSDRSRKRHEFREARLLKKKQMDEERRRQKREALAKKKQAEQKGAADKGTKTQNADAVQAALERVKARKKTQHIKPKNTTELTEAQQRQIDEAEARRKKITRDDS